jgi:alpha-beta hydrolase superfamily lysophospholipase
MEREMLLRSVNGEQLIGKLWGNPEQARAIVVLMHGLGEHIGRYEHVAAKFVERDFALLAFDQQGHGKTAGKRGVIDPDDSMRRDIEAMLRLAKQLAPGKPVFLYGHSMGSMEALYYGLKGQEKVDGIIATSPPLDPRTMSGTQRRLIKLIKPLFPKLTVNNGLETSGLSRDAEVVRRYVADPLNHPKASVRLASFINDAAAYVREHADEWSLPLYLAHGSADPICPVEGSREFAKKLGKKVTYKEWDGLYHETHNEPEQDLVVATMLNWLEDKVDEKAQ